MDFNRRAPLLISLPLTKSRMTLAPLFLITPNPEVPDTVSLTHLQAICRLQHRRPPDSCHCVRNQNCLVSFLVLGRLLHQSATAFLSPDHILLSHRRHPHLRDSCRPLHRCPSNLPTNILIISRQQHLHHMYLLPPFQPRILFRHSSMLHQYHHLLCLHTLSPHLHSNLEGMHQPHHLRRRSNTLTCTRGREG
jgi:hypothetical protein